MFVIVKPQVDGPADPDSHVSKRPACHLMNDSLLDHQSSRSNNENRVTPQDIEFNQSQSNEPSGSSLLQRISLLFKDNSRTV
ncbi:hypothetical protein KEM48_002572 [Puccinia striiformis f. sp. tritici PST-130]|nr:hypothetical protein KEM48_002572 [Puccinia striiformis f. sp. tritici PST-130]